MINHAFANHYSCGHRKVRQDCLLVAEKIHYNDSNNCPHVAHYMNIIVKGAQECLQSIYTHQHDLCDVQIAHSFPPFNQVTLLRGTNTSTAQIPR